MKIMICLQYFVSFSYEEVKEISDHLLSKTKQRPTIGIVCGSGLGGLADDIESKEIFPYDDIPGFPLSTGNSYKV